MKSINLSYELADLDYVIKIILNQFRKRRTSLDISSLVECSLEKYKWSPPRLVQIPKSNGKLRDIFIFKNNDNFLQKVINEILTQKFGYLINKNVFSYTKGLRTFDGAIHVQRHLRENKLFGIKLDISNYFININQESIFAAIDELIGDSAGKILLKNLFSLSSYIKDGKLVSAHLGIMPGCALASFLANYLLKDVDKFIQDNTMIYARYSDDLLFFCDSESKLQETICAVYKLLNKKGLSVNPSKVKYFKNNQTIDFLGLHITKKFIDINTDSFCKIKKLIKKVAKKYRKKAEINGVTKNSTKYVQQAIKVINRLLYKSIFSRNNMHKSNRLVYIFSNITTWKTLRELDFYICDCLRYIYTGKHNKANYRKLSTRTLEKLGFYSTVKMYHLFKMGKDIFFNEAFLLRKSYPQYEELIHATGRLPKFREQPSNYKKSTPSSFLDLLDSLIELNGYFIISDKKVKPQNILFDLKNKTVSVGDIPLLRANIFQVKKLRYFLEDSYYICDTLSMPLCKTEVNERSEILYQRYIQGCYPENTSSKFSCSDIHYRFPIVREISIQQLIPMFGSKHLTMNLSPGERYTRFISYLYCHIISGQLWDDLNYSKQFIQIGKSGLALILKREWVE